MAKQPPDDKCLMASRIALRFNAFEAELFSVDIGKSVFPTPSI
jgi:hypothetical protein